MSNINDRIHGATHSVPTEWMASRVVSWMMDECHGKSWWITGLAPNGRFLHANFPQTFFPENARQAYAHHVCAELNKHLNYGGTWLTGWLLDGHRFYLIWKDADGDIQIPIECDKAWIHIREWPVESWLKQANQAYDVWYQVMEQVAPEKHEQIKLAQDRPLI